MGNFISSIDKTLDRWSKEIVGKYIAPIIMAQVVAVQHALSAVHDAAEALTSDIKTILHPFPAHTSDLVSILDQKIHLMKVEAVDLGKIMIEYLQKGILYGGGILIIALATLFIFG